MLVESKTIKFAKVSNRVITLNNAGKRNPLSIDMMYKLMKEILNARHARIVLVGKDPLVSFCSGLHREELIQTLKSDGSHARMLEPLVTLFRLLASHPLPTSSVVTGKTWAGGVGLACCVDVVVMQRSATLGLPGKGPYEKLARILIPILNRRRKAESSATKQWLGGTFSASKSLGFKFATNLSAKKSFNELVWAAIEGMERLTKRASYTPGPPRLEPDVFIAVCKAMKAAMSPRAIKALKKHYGIP